MSSTTMTIHSLSCNEDDPSSKRNEEMSAAEALLKAHSCGPKHEYQVNVSGIRPDTYAGLESLAEQANARHVFESSRPSPPRSSEESELPGHLLSSKRVNSGGLDALASLALEAHSEPTTSNDTLRPYLMAGGITSASPSSSSDEDSDAMPPPPPRSQRGRGRRRSASNPEGMEKWDSLSGSTDRSSRRHFVLPASILEEELAEASAAIQQRRLRENTAKSIPEEPDENCDDSSASPDSVMDLGCATVGALQEKQQFARDPAEDDKENEDEGEGEEEEEEEELDESNMSPEDLLKRARSRLLEDLSEGNLNGEKGVLTLPHSLSKYKEVYNKNGRIGIYTPAERAAIIARFNRKRQRRVWNKKIRYNCRKSLADRRLRVKGRFVKRSEQEQLAKEIQARAEQELVATQEGGHDNYGVNDCGDNDKDMPDVNDPEANFAPTEDQPFRRLRRHTIT